MGKQNIKANIAKHREALEKMALDIWAKPRPASVSSMPPSCSRII